MFPQLVFLSMLSALHQMHLPKEQYVEALEGIAKGIELHLQDVQAEREIADLERQWHA